MVFVSLGEVFLVSLPIRLFLSWGDTFQPLYLLVLWPVPLGKGRNQCAAGCLLGYWPESTRHSKEVLNSLE